MYYMRLVLAVLVLLSTAVAALRLGQGSITQRALNSSHLYARTSKEKAKSVRVGGKKGGAQVTLDLSRPPLGTRVYGSRRSKALIRNGRWKRSLFKSARVAVTVGKPGKDWNELVKGVYLMRQVHAHPAIENLIAMDPDNGMDKLEGVAQADDVYYMVTDPFDVTVGDLLELGWYKPDTSEAYMHGKQILSALHWLHSNGTAHQDLDIDNLRVNVTDGIGTLKLGFSSFATTKTKVRAPPAGTDKKVVAAPGGPASPEAWEVKYRHASGVFQVHEYNPFENDIWAAGVILASMLYGSSLYDTIYGQSSSLSKHSDGWLWLNGDRTTRIKMGKEAIPEFSDESWELLWADVFTAQGSERLGIVKFQEVWEQLWERNAFLINHQMTSAIPVDASVTVSTGRTAEV